MHLDASRFGTRASSGQVTNAALPLFMCTLAHHRGAELGIDSNTKENRYAGGGAVVIVVSASSVFKNLTYTVTKGLCMYI